MNTLLAKLLPIALQAFTKKNMTTSTAVSVALGGFAAYQYSTTEDAIVAGVLTLASIVCFFIRQNKEEK